MFMKKKYYIKNIFGDHEYNKEKNLIKKFHLNV